MHAAAQCNTLYLTITVLSCVVSQTGAHVVTVVMTTNDTCCLILAWIAGQTNMHWITPTARQVRSITQGTR